MNSIRGIPQVNKPLTWNVYCNNVYFLCDEHLHCGNLLHEQYVPNYESLSIIPLTFFVG